MNYTFLQVHDNDIRQYRDLMRLYGKVFQDEEAYDGDSPTDAYVKRFLQNPSHIVLIACSAQGEVVGGLVAYVLEKFEQERTEIFVYDLAVSPEYQRQGVASGLFLMLKNVALEKRAYIIFVQADKVDSGAISFYKTISTQEEETVNFDIEVK